MSVAKGIFIADIAEGRKVEGVFMVKEMSRGETKAGKPFLRLTLMDRSGEIGGPVWDDAEALAPLCRPGAFLAITGQGESYRGSQQLRIVRAEAVAADQVALTDFMPSGDFDREQLAAELAELIAGLGNPHLRQLLTTIFQDRELAARFHTAPAAKTMHHAYLGGLLEHTVAVARLAAAVCALYPGLDRDLLLAGALLHDLGKTEELVYRGYPFDYSTRGRLVGHLVIGAELVRQQAEALPGFPPELIERLQHLILSHHGRHEFGTPTLPMMQEAFILHFLDDLDAKVNYFERLRRHTGEPGYQWTDYQRNLERFLYVQGHGPEGPEDEPGGQAAGGETPAAAPAAGAKRPKRRSSAAPKESADQPAADPQLSVRQKGLWS